MSAPNVLVVCYCVLILLPNLGALDDPTLDDVISAIERMVEFYSRTYREINLDGIYGLRALEGQLMTVLDEKSHGKHSHLPESTWDRISRLYVHTRTISNSSMPYLKAQDTRYYMRMLPLITNPLSVFKEYRLIDDNLRWGTNVHKTAGPFDEEFSDQCMSELMGSQEEPGNAGEGTSHTAGQGCRPSRNCLMNMFARGHGEYQITHQLLYTLLAEQMGCVSVLDDWLKKEGEPGGIYGIQREFCTNNLMEIRQQVAALGGNIIPIYQDLFMEQEFVCPTLGFMQFLHLDWLQQILSWQKPNGCYGTMEKSKLGRSYTPQDALDYEYLNDNDKHHKLDAEQQKNAQNIVQMQQIPQESLVIQQTNNTLRLQEHSHDPVRGDIGPKSPSQLHDDPAMGSKNSKTLQNNQFNEPIDPDLPLDKVYGNQQPMRKLLDLQPEPAPNEKSQWTSRRLLLEKGLADNCLSHKTAVAAGALSQYLRFLIDPGPDEYRRSVSISGRNLLREPIPSMEIENEQEANKDGEDEMAIQQGDDDDDGDGGEADEDYGADDDDGYDDDDEDYVIDSLHERDINPKFHHDNAKIAIGSDGNERDEEYEQYIEEDDDERDQGAGDKMPLEPIGDLEGQQNDPFNIGNLHRDEEDGYNYYDNEEEENHLVQARSGHFDERKLEQVGPVQHDVVEASAHRDAAIAANLESSLGKIYLFIFLTMIAFLVLLYRFIKHRKVVIRYYHR